MTLDERQAIRRFLSAGEWFGGLPSALQDLILSRSLVRRFAKGQVISVEDSASKGLYALLEGEVYVVRDLGSGDEALLHIAEPGYWFGEFAVLSGRPTIATVVAHSSVRVLQLPKAQFDRIVADEPRYYPDFARLVFDRFAALLRVFVDLQGLAPEERLRRRLAAMAQVQLQDRPQAGPVSLVVSQSELGRMVGVSRQTLNGLLSKLEGEGLIELGFRRVRVFDLARLAHPRDETDPMPRRGTSARRRAATARSRASTSRVE